VTGSGAGGDELTQQERAAILVRLLESSVDLIAVLDRDTRPIELSRSWEALLGWSSEQLTAVPFLDLVHPDDLPMVVDAVGPVLAGGSARGANVRLRTAAGGYRWVQGGAVGDAATGRIYVTVVDVQERKELEDALRDQLALEETISSIATGLIGLEPTAVPAAIERGLGTLGRALGVDRVHFLRGSRYPDDVTYLEWYDPELPQPSHVPHPDRDVQAWWLAALREGRVLRVEDVEELREEAPKVVDALLEDGVRSVLHIPLPPHRRIWGFLTFVAVRDRVPLNEAFTSLLRVAGESFLTALATSDDAVALGEARRELEQRNADLERSNEELERFAYAAAHDLKAPLVRIEMALAAMPVPVGPPRELLDVAQRAARRMRQLIEDLLAFAAVGQTRGAAGPVDLDALVDQVLLDLEPAVEAGGVRVERSPLPIVEGHRPLLSQLLQNLLSNAVKFARPGGGGLVRLAAHSDRQGHTISITDNGIGIDPADREDVFGVFTRLNPADAYPGSGVGLSTCARVVQHHGGRISLHDGIDGGVAVRVWLPRRPPEPTAVPADDLLGGGFVS